MCPLYGCFSCNKRMPQHLQQVHGLKAGTTQYYQMLKQAQPFVMENVEIQPRSNPVLEEESSGSNLSRLDIFQRFLNWSVSVDGGRGNEKSAKQSVQELTYMMKATKSDDVAVLFDKKKKRNDFLLDFAETTMKYKPLTIKRFLKALIDFCSFVIDDQVEIPDVTPEEVLRMKMRVNQWKKSYNEAAKRQEWTRMQEEQDILITPEQVRSYENSECVKQARELFVGLSSPYREDLSRQEYTLMRDYLLTEIEISNCHRSGVASNMTLEEVEKVKEINGKFVVQVAKHKTQNTHGPAMVVLSEEIYSYLANFIKFVRSSVITDCNEVFLSFFGKPLASGAISKQVNSLWQKAGVYGDEPPNKNISANIFRKSGSTAIEEHNPAASKYVSSLLSHSEQTSKKYYRLIEKQKYALQGSECLKEIFRESTKAVEDKKRFVWSEEQSTELKEIFSAHIQKKEISINAVRSLRPKFSHLSDISDEKIRDKVRGLWRFSAQDANSDEFTNPLPEVIETVSEKIRRLYPQKEESDAESYATDEPYVADKDDDWHSNATSTASNVLFTKRDVAILVQLCGDIIEDGPQSVERITRALKKSKEGLLVLKTYKMTQIQSRLKYERRQYRSKNS